MVACLFDKATKKYFIGKSGHDEGGGDVPKGIWEYISNLDKDKDIKDDSFGINCAEVHCLIKAFQERKISQNWRIRHL